MFLKLKKIMGLSISVYKNVKVTNRNDEYDFIAFVIDEDWSYKIKNLQRDGAYVGDCTDSGLSYSYGSHNRFRELLLNIIKRKDLLDDRGCIIWSKVEKEKVIPFYELINFADNEGCLDYEISEILYNDFINYKDKAMLFLENDFHFKQRYLDWIEVFKDGKEKNSVVVFH